MCDLLAIVPIKLNEKPEIKIPEFITFFLLLVALKRFRNWIEILTTRQTATEWSSRRVCFLCFTPGSESEYRKTHTCRRCHSWENPKQNDAPVVRLHASSLKRKLRRFLTTRRIINNITYTIVVGTGSTLLSVSSFKPTEFVNKKSNKSIFAARTHRRGKSSTFRQIHPRSQAWTCENRMRNEKVKIDVALLCLGFFVLSRVLSRGAWV